MQVRVATTVAVLTLAVAACSPSGSSASSAKKPGKTSTTAVPSTAASTTTGPLVKLTFVAVSGTIGAAKAAAASGIPAISVSAGVGNPPDYSSAATLADIWIPSHRSAYTGAHQGATDVININVPTCTPKAPRGLKQVPAATALTGRDVNKVDCSSTVTSFHDDVTRTSTVSTP